MRVLRAGARRNRGQARLADSPADVWVYDDYLRLRVKGRDGKTTYRYDIELSHEEFADLIVSAMEERYPDDITMGSLAAGISSFLKRALPAKPAVR